MTAPEPGQEATCRTCGAPVTWWPGPPPLRPDLPGAWWDAEDRYGVRGPAGHVHQP